MKENDFVVDAIVMLDGENGGFFSYMYHEEALKLQAIGLENAEQILLRETTDRLIPDSLKQGVTQICDVWVRLEPNMVFILN